MEMRFHSIQIFTHEMQELSWYKEQEAKYNKLMAQVESAPSEADNSGVYKSIFGEDPPKFVSQNQDIVHQLISGAGWRVRGWNESNGTRSALVVSSDSRGVQFLVTSTLEPTKKKQKKEQKESPAYEYFAVARAAQYFDSQKGRAGIGTLCFEVNEMSVAKIKANYQSKHPNLIVSDESYDGGNLKSITVYAYYLPGGEKKADPGTTLRFIERTETSKEEHKDVLPGFERQECEFGVDSVAYFDHWVSNVFDRLGFINTLSDCLGFSPKVDFNAGVVAAGEAIIESTVIGNDSALKATSKQEILVDQSQVYLPINNALSEVGHVHLYLKEIGQGIQHIASRVPDLLAFISRTNKFREVTGHGFSFLNIPRSYYGRLSLEDLESVEGVGSTLADTIMQALNKGGLVDETGIVLIDIEDGPIQTCLEGVISGEVLSAVVETIKNSRFSNLVKLLGSHFSDQTYLDLVKNKILIDIQGKDVLYQIFTANILQAEPGSESPFLEFIQRVCSEEKGADGKPLPIRPGCGGFGIRNFLTLFLSIEVNKAMNSAKTAQASGDVLALKLAQTQVNLLTAQLDESNPILTAISDAMSAEADALAVGDKAGAEEWNNKKEAANKQLQECSNKYKLKMKDLRTA